MHNVYKTHTGSLRFQGYRCESCTDPCNRYKDVPYNLSFRLEKSISDREQQYEDYVKGKLT